MSNAEEYITNRDLQVEKNLHDTDLKMATHIMADNLIRTNYIKNFTWLGRPVLQYPTDLMVVQELIWQIKPNIIIETGLAMGGSAVFFSSILSCLGNGGQVVSIDVDIRKDAREALVPHPMADRITMIEGSSIDEKVVEQVRRKIHPGMAIMVVLDSNHTEEHVMKELYLYSPMVTIGSYLIVQDTAIEIWDEKYPSPNRPWGKGDNPMTAVKKFLEINNNFMVDKEIGTRALITGSSDGWLKRIK